ncbi:MAG TPA: CHAT domain-containing protein, partial [Saprospiraceae bacterium]|nr:CHAT domain-containing protein [Saprospiraceae bacterium]
YNLHRGLQVTPQKNQVREKASIPRTLSEIFHSKKDFRQALKHQQKAVKLLTADTSLINDLDIPDSRTIVSSKLDLFKTLVQKGKTIHALYQETKNPIYLKAALNTYLYLSQLTDDIRSFYQSEESQLLLLDEAKDFYEKAMETAFLLYDKNPNQQFLENAFFFTEKSKSELLLEELRKKEFSGKGIIADSLLKKQYNLKVAINYNHKLLKKENRKIEQKNKSKIKDLETTIFNLQKQWSDLKDEINLSYPTYSALTEQLPITLNKMQSKLDDSQVLLEYFVGKKNIYLFKVTQQNATLLKISNDFNLDILLTDLFGNLKMTGTNGISQYSTIAYQLYQKLLQPAQLSSQKNVIIIPDGRLENLPFGILLTKKGNTNSPKDLPYFIKKMATSYAYSATILSYQMSQKTSLASSIIGVFPIFEKTEKELLHSEKIHKSLSRFSGSFLLKEEATKQNFLNNVEDFQIIHFSSHARGKDNIQESPSIDLFDGSLIISDLQTYNLSASLAVLSACETNVGEYRNGEGIMSLSRGFTFAGVPSIITSVSNVMEESTSSIIISLYKNLEKRMPKHEALRQAKLEYLNNPNLPNSECSPYYWGTFLAIGNMDNITFKYKSKNDIWYYVFGTVIFFIVGIFVKRKKSHKSFLVYQSKPKVEN